MPAAAPAPRVDPPPVSAARLGASVILGFAVAALVNAAVLATRPTLRARIGVGAVTHLYAAGYLLGIGVIIAAGGAAWRRFGPRSRLVAHGVTGAISWALGYAFYGAELSGFADTMRKIPSPSMRVALLTLGLSLSVPAAIVVVGAAIQRFAWWIGLAAGVAAIVANGVELVYPNTQLFVTQSYPGLHLLVAILGGLSIALSLARAPHPARPLPKAAAPAFVGIAALWGAASILVLPGNDVLIQLRRYPGAVLFPFLGRLHAPARGAPSVPAGEAAWFADRSQLPSIPASKPGLIPGGSIVILIGIDSMRADLLTEEKYRDELPALFRLRDQGVWFTHARAPGNSTAPVLASMFTSRAYSQLYWTASDRVPESRSLVFPHEDQTVRFPEILTRSGVRTENFDAAGWILNELGVVRGFVEQRTIRRGEYGPAGALTNALLPRLRQPELDPQFFFAHLFDAQAPHNSAGKRETEFLGYIAELAHIDRQLARLENTLSQKELLDRTAIVIYADHGEAFGEHGNHQHANSLYEELLRVPLIVSVPGVKHLVVDDDVSLLDVAPTILDLFGLATPGQMMGQSLTGYLRGESPKLARPILAEGRLQHAMILPDGHKVIYDTRTHVVEIYDLRADPHEEQNLYREGDPASAQRLGVLTAFFDANTLRRPGYEVPYRMW
jgi:hypothetical protein